MPRISARTCRTRFLVAAGCLFSIAGASLGQTLDTSNIPTKRAKELRGAVPGIERGDPAPGAPSPRGVPINDNCPLSLLIGEGTFPFTTIGATNDGTASCGLSATSPDVWFLYHASATGVATVQTCGFAAYDSVLSVHTTCGTPDLVCNDDACSVQSRIQFPVTLDTAYLIRVSGYNGATGAGSIAVSLAPPAPPCLFEHHDFATTEPEPCGANTNGGCNQPAGQPAVYTEIPCDSTVAGTSWAVGGTRDTDWFRINVAAGTPVTVTLQTAFPAVLFAFAEACPPTITQFTDATCSRDGILEFVATGPTVVFVAPGSLDGGAVFDGLPCGTAATNGYNLSALFGRHCPGPCGCDWNHDGALTSQDFFNFLVDFFNGTGDFDGDGATTSQDFFNFLVCFFNGCPNGPVYDISLLHTGTINDTDFVATGTGTANPNTGTVIARWELNRQIPGYDPLMSIVTLGGTGGGGTVCRTADGAQNLLDLSGGNWDFVATVSDALLTVGSVRTAENHINVEYNTTGNLVGQPILRLRQGGFIQTPTPSGLDEEQLVIMQTAQGQHIGALKQVQIRTRSGASPSQEQFRSLLTSVLYRSPDSNSLIIRYDSDVTIGARVTKKCKYTRGEPVMTGGCQVCPAHNNDDRAVYCTPRCRDDSGCKQENFLIERTCSSGKCTYTYTRVGCIEDCTE